jgi:hypothetical protein
MTHEQRRDVLALRLDDVGAPAVSDGPIDRASFLAYIQQVLVPTLRSGDVVVLDNIGANPPFTIGGTRFGVGDTRKRINEYLRVDPDRVHPFTHARGAPR